MPLVYAETSALFAFFHPRDQFSRVVTAAVAEVMPDFVYWSFLRYEVRHVLRHTRTNSHGELAWRALRAGERTHARLRWQSDLRAESVIESADELSAQHALASQAGSMDFLHVAAARRLHLLAGLDEFWTCDTEQAGLAALAGLPVHHFKLKETPGQSPAGQPV